MIPAICALRHYQRQLMAVAAGHVEPIPSSLLWMLIMLEETVLVVPVAQWTLWTYTQCISVLSQCIHDILCADIDFAKTIPHCPLAVQWTLWTYNQCNIGLLRNSMTFCTLYPVHCHKMLVPETINTLSCIFSFMCFLLPVSYSAMCTQPLPFKACVECSHHYSTTVHVLWLHT